MVPHHNMHCMVSFSPYEAKSQNKFFLFTFSLHTAGGRFEKELAPEYFLSIVEAFHLNRSSSFGLLSRFVKPQFFCADPFPGNSHWLFASMFYEVKNSAVDALQETNSYLIIALPYYILPCMDSAMIGNNSLFSTLINDGRPRSQFPFSIVDPC